ncbi:MAG: MBOAT family protein, partial [Leptospiraceae bacterium]|nr:MBOAT family protein [Leptospiraceae bacterium]
VFDNPSYFSWESLLVGMLSYSLQIYGDFSGYTDIARGSALIFKIELPENFIMPYLSSSFTEFWKRWHVTLSNWLKSFLYIPLGGNRQGELKTYVNLIITMLLGGLWHGANWTFIVWGGVHGLFLAIEKLGKKYYFTLFPVGSTGGKVQKWSNFMFIKTYSLIVIFLVCILWVYFRAKNIEVANLYLQRLFLFEAGQGVGRANLNLFATLLSGTMIFHFIGYKYQERIQNYWNSPLRLNDGFLASIIFIFLNLFGRETRPFIYFVF